MEHLSSKIILIFYLSVLLLGCSSPTKREQSERKADSAKIKSSLPLESRQDTLGVMFDNKKPFEVLSLKVVPIYTTFFTDSLECQEWGMSIQTFSKVIKNSRSISGTEQDLAFANHSCGILGQLQQGGQHFEIELNAGAWMYIRCRDTTLLFGDFNRIDTKYFLSGPNLD
jgi:hypothetical protein